MRSIGAQLSDQFSWLSHQCIEQNPALFSGGRDDGSDVGEEAQHVWLEVAQTQEEVVADPALWSSPAFGGAISGGNASCAAIPLATMAS